METNYQPYTYLIRFKPTLELYYGSKTAIGCHPDQFWVKYFTTSKVVKRLIKEFGKDSFEVLYIKNHATKEAALKWETMYLVSVDAALNENYLNRHNGGKNFVCNGHTEAWRKKHREDMTGRVASIETKKKMSEWQIGIPKSEETKKKLCESHGGENHYCFGKFGAENITSKQYIVTHPDGHEEVIFGLIQFSNHYNLCPAHLTKCTKGKHKQHKGYKCRYYIEELN